MRKEIYRRRLRTTEQVAQREYLCDHCYSPIFPGDYYKSQISVQKILISEEGKIRVKRTIYTLRQHIEPPCDEPDPEWERDCNKLEKDGELEVLSAA